MSMGLAFERLECMGSKQASFVNFLGLDWRTVTLDANSIFKLVAKFEVDLSAVSIATIQAPGLIVTK